MSSIDINYSSRFHVATVVSNGICMEILLLPFLLLGATFYKSDVFSSAQRNPDPLLRVSMGKQESSDYSNASLVLKHASSFVVFYCNFVVGVIFSLTGPALQSLSKHLDASVTDVSRVLTVQSCCYLAGALSAGLIFRFVNRYTGSICALAPVAISIALLPHANSLLALHMAGGISGFGIGIFDPAQIAWIIDIWRNDAGPFISSQHFMYSLGTVVAPLILGPFLSDEPHSTASNLTDEGILLHHQPDSPSRLQVPFGITGALMGIGVIGQIVIFFTMRRHAEKCKNSPSPQVELTPCPVASTSGSEASARWEFIVVALGCAFMGFYVSMEMSTMQFLSSFAQYSPIGLSEKEGAEILSGLTSGYAVTRGIGIFIALKVAPQYILTTNLFLVLVGNTILFVIGKSSVPWLWAGSICLGIGFSTTYAAFYAYLEKHIFVSEWVASIITVFAGLMSSLYTLILGSTVENVPEILNYIDYVSIVMASVSFLALYRLTTKEAPQAEVAKSGVQ